MTDIFCITERLSIETASKVARASMHRSRTPIGVDELGNPLTSYLGNVIVSGLGNTRPWK